MPTFYSGKTISSPWKLTGKKKWEQESEIRQVEQKMIKQINKLPIAPCTLVASICIFSVAGSWTAKLGYVNVFV